VAARIVLLGSSGPGASLRVGVFFVFTFAEVAYFHIVQTENVTSIRRYSERCDFGVGRGDRRDSRGE